MGKIVVGASADYVEEQEDVSVDKEKILDLRVSRPKENMDDVCLGVGLSREQQNEIMEVLGKREKIFTDISGKISIIKHRVYLVGDCPFRCRPYGRNPRRDSEDNQHRNRTRVRFTVCIADDGSEEEGRI